VIAPDDANTDRKITEGTTRQRRCATSNETQSNRFWRFMIADE